MSSISEDLHLRINALGSERILQLLDIEQTNRLRLTHAAERTLLYQTHKLGLSSAGTIESGIVTNHAPTIEPPIIPDLSNNQSQQSFPIGVNDPDPTDTHTFTFTSRPGTWVSISNNQLRINPNGRTPGTYNVGLRVTDNGTPQESDTGTVSFRILQANRDPTLTVPGAQTVERGGTLTFSVSARDLDEDPISYRITNGKKTGMELNSTSGEFEWTPTDSQTGGTITIQASDGRGGTDTGTVSISITTPQASPPYFQPAIRPQSRTGTGRVSFRVYARDDDDLDITFSDGSNAGTFSGRRKLNDGRWTALWTSPNYSSVGVKTVVITATAGGESVSQTVTITLSAHPRPVLSRIGNKTVRKTETLTFTARATNTTSYSLSSDDGVPSNALNSNTGAFSWTPGSGVSQGDKDAIITATGPGGTATETITITVQAAPTAQESRPVISRIDRGDKTTNPTNAGTSTVRSFTATDPDNLPLRITAINATISEHPTEADRYYAKSTWPAAGESKTVTIRVQAIGGNPANEYTEVSFTLNTDSVDYRPNITITRPIDTTRINSRPDLVGQSPASSMQITISATRYNGEKIPLTDLTVTASAGLGATPFYSEPNASWWINIPIATTRSGTIFAQYRDTVNNISYTGGDSARVAVI